ncbi:hypothetical protein HYT25_03230 [Candidatus Pacearchaeota archaeon]|nr:hypothetical protein [Candidatus Pacearchaeota archaeon]
MYMHCGWIQTILSALILVFVIWPTSVFSSAVSQWIVVISAALLLIHALVCHKCGGVCAKWMMKSSGRRRRR